MSVERAEEDTGYLTRPVNHMDMRTVVVLARKMVEAYMLEKSTESPAIWLSKKISWNKFPKVVELFSQCGSGGRTGEPTYWRRVTKHEMRIASNKALVEICFGLELMKGNLEVLPPEPSPMGEAAATSGGSDQSEIWAEGFLNKGGFVSVPCIKRKKVEEEISPITSVEEE
jgi:hypothetical protein